MRYVGPILLIVVSLALLVSEAAAEPPATPAKSSVCPAPAEDHPKWDWTLCGNGKRGVWVKRGTPKVGAIHPDGKRRHRVVNVRQYCRAELAPRTEALTGDPSCNVKV
jgi:hypothetical protein